MTTPPLPPIVLTIAGSDSGGGAGIQADLKTISALGAFGVCAVTGITAQNTTGVQAVHPIPAEMVGRQMDSVLDDFDVGAAKTGMLANADIIRVVAERIRRRRLTNLVVDPVMVAKGGGPLLAAEAVESLVSELIPLALVVTPNLDEAEKLAGFAVRSEADMIRAAEAIRRLGAAHVLIKGGHRADSATDILYDGRDVHRLPCERIPTRHTHGTGCVYSAAIATHLAFGRGVLEAVTLAKQFITEAIRHSLPLGHGIGPANPMFRLGS